MTHLAADAESALVAAALEARQRAYAPYSRFLVGAALLCDDGTVVTGCNVENASYGLCVCAARNAVGTAVGQGRRAFRAIAVATASVPPASPCGMCRQVLAEFAPTMPVIMVNDAGDCVRATVAALLPGTFTPDQLKSGQRGAAG